MKRGQSPEPVFVAARLPEGCTTLASSSVGLACPKAVRCGGE